MRVFSSLRISVGALLAGLLCGGAALAAARTPPTGPEVLARRCLSCHDGEKKTGGVDLSTRAGALAVGAAQPEAGNRLLRAVAAGRMPPPGKLPAEEVAALRAWAGAGARYAQEPLRPQSLADQPLWSLEPIRRPAPPRTPFDSLAKGPLDRFVFARLAAAGLRPGAPAGRAELLRRVTVDLTGLPPTPEEVGAFLADRAPNAYERVVDRLLASPAYGERWGRHWLDVVRFGESHGYEQNHLRPTAWPYRDYVIRAFNTDKPYDQFLREQLAGDAVPGEDPWKEVATGFLVAGVHDTVGNQTEEGRRQQRANDLDDIVSTAGEAFLGLTVGCAKCHDHKFDPIPQRDYYRLAAVFAGVRHGERTLPAGGAIALEEGRHVASFPPVAAKFVRFQILETNDGAEPCLDELEVHGPEGDDNLARADRGGRATASSLLPGHAIHQVEHLNDGRLGNDRSWISATRGTGWAQIELQASLPVSRVVWSRDGTTPPRFRDRTPALYRILVSADGKSFRTVFEGRPFAADEVRPGMRAYIGAFGPLEPVHLLERGDVMRRGDEVTPGGLSRLSGLPPDLVARTEPQRRLALAAWLADARNPLTARVIVNRVWHYHFGRGLVGTPSDFGHNGERPSHPELLDWLAAELREPTAKEHPGRPWTLKRLHRLIVTSYIYRQGSGPDPRGLARDAGNVLLWRMPLRRMEAEAVRDAILAVSGKLDRRMGGPGFPLFKYRVVNVAIYEPMEEYGPETWRRTVYRQAARAIREELLGTFDCPESSQRSPRRPSTTTALQALSLLNGPFLTQQAGFFAARLRAEAGEALAAQIPRAFRLAFGRAPTAAEQAAAADLARAHGLEALCRGLLNANEFLYF